MRSLSSALAVFIASQSISSAQFWVDFNSTQGGGGSPVPDDPADPTNAFHQEPDFMCYHAAHEDPTTQITASYEVDFANTGMSTVTMTPEWPNTDVSSVQQSIGRVDGQADTWIGNNVNLLRDWIGADTRTGQSGNGAWDGTTGTPTYFQLRFAGLPQASYEMTAFFHDVEHMNSDFTIEVSSDGGTTFGEPIVGRMTNSLSGGNPAENEVLSGTAPNVDGGDPLELSSTQVFSFDSVGGEELVLRIAALSKGSAVHSEFVGLNGFKLQQGDASNVLGLVITKVERNSESGAVELTWNSKPGKVYVVRASDDLSGDPLNWPDLEDGLVSGGDETTFTDSTAVSRRFYIVEEL
ncbi:MAG: hypothetical protein ACJAQT_003165 [Akkermansiaceae bacterium]|jgi:hypothetical protein